MIISHKFKFIFIKTFKTAGTSIEVYLSRYCDDSDILTPIFPHIETHYPRNYLGAWNPFDEILQNKCHRIKYILNDLVHRKKFYNHIPAKTVRARIDSKTWRNYFKFSVERNPWDKTLSHYHMLNYLTGDNKKISLQDYFNNGSFCLNYPLYTDDTGELLVDKIVHYENLDKGLKTIFDDLRIPFNGTLGMHAKSNYRHDRKPYQKVYSEHQKKIIEDIFRQEIQLHGYTY